MPCARFILLICLLSLAGGCRSWGLLRPVAESGRVLVREQLVIETDFPLPPDNRLLDELVELRTRVHQDLALPISETPIQVKVFGTEETYLAYMKQHFPAADGRRAFFVETDSELAVYAWWGDFVAEDLRHEVTHGYLHSTLQELPLWLDEGLAEYYEVPSSLNGRHNGHVRLLLKELRDGRWHPNLDRLEQFAKLEEMQHLEYAEAWLWAHFLMKTTPARRVLLQSYLQGGVERRESTSRDSIAVRLKQQSSDDLGTQLAAHLLLLANEGR